MGRRTDLTLGAAAVGLCLGAAGCGGTRPAAGPAGSGKLPLSVALARPPAGAAASLSFCGGSVVVPLDPELHSAILKLLRADFQRAVILEPGRAPTEDLVATVAWSPEELSLALREPAGDDVLFETRAGDGAPFYPCEVPAAYWTFYRKTRQNAALAEFSRRLREVSLSLPRRLAAVADARTLFLEAQGREKAGEIRTARGVYERTLVRLDPRMRLFAEVFARYAPLAAKTKAPPIPEEARQRLLAGQAGLKAAKDPAAAAAARADLEHAARLAPWWPVAWLRLGDAQEEAEELKAAAQSLRRYIRLDPKAEDASSVAHRIRSLEAR